MTFTISARWTRPARFAALVLTLSATWLSGAACDTVAGWQDVVSAEWRDAPARVWSWRQAVIVPERVVVAGARTLWLVGRGGVLRSADRGATWQAVRRGLGEFDRPIASTDGQQLCVIESETGEAALVCTEDGGASWLRTANGRLIYVAGTADLRNLWLLAEVRTSAERTFEIRRSRDGGRSWAEEWRGALSGQLHVSADGSLAILMADNGLVVRHDPASGRWAPDERSVLGPNARVTSVLTGSPDGESVWAVAVREGSSAAVAKLSARATRVEWCPTTVPDIQAINFRDRLRPLPDGRPAVLLHWSFTTARPASTRSQALRSTDGCSWTPWAGAPQSAVDVAHGNQAGEFWALAQTRDGAGLLHSTDDGKEWRPTTVIPIDDLSFGTVLLLDSGTLLTLNGPVVLEGSVSSGWRRTHLDVPGTMSALASTPDRGTVWAVGDGGVVAESRSPGTWEVRRVPADRCASPCDLLDVFAADDGRNVWIVGRGGVLLHSADAGVTFEAAPAPSGGQPPTFAAVHGTPDGRTVLAVAAEGVAVRFADGAWSAPARIGDKPAPGLADVFVAADGRTAWAVAAPELASAQVYRSGDSGRTWLPHAVPIPFSIAATRAFISGTHDGRELWIASDEELLASADGGQTWHREPIAPRDASGVAAAAPSDSSWSDFEEPLQPQSIGVSPGGGARVAAVTTASGRSSLVEAWPVRVRPQITRARFVTDTSGRHRLELRLAGVGDGRPPSMEIFGGGAQALAANRLIPVKDAAFVPPGSNDDVWTLPIDPSGSLGVPAGEAVHFRIELVEADGVRQAFVLPPFVYLPWYEPYQTPVLAAGGVLAALAAAGALLLFVAPLALVRLAHPVGVLIDAAPSPALGGVVKALAHLLILPALATHARVLDAWVRRHRSTVQKAFDEVPAVQTAHGFVALPVRIGDATKGELIERPSPGIAGRLFARDRAVVEIVGPGGAGKTTLAVQVARWAMEGGGTSSLPHPMLPVFVDEDTRDLAAVVRRKLRAMVDPALPDWLCEALVRKRRVLVIVDRLSEREAETEKHVSGVHGAAAVGALLVTSRRPIVFESGAPATLYPQPLESATLLHFMTSLLRAGDGAELFGGIQQQIDLGRRLAALIPSRAGTTVSITPLLVRLFVDRALALVNSGRSLDELPASIPDAYFDYLRAINPTGAGVLNAIPHEQMLEAASTLAGVSLRADEAGSAFVPREFLRSRAIEALRRDDRPAGDAAIRRLVDNGVLLERTSGPEPAYRFALDPVAEFLAAYDAASRCGTEAACWSELMARVDAAPSAAGFRLALALTCDAYGGDRGWPCGQPPP
jgi:photosystem II stability/assembly factor-like uncharacterized protein